ncbi:MAG TPA: protein phosphatase 2C domain-containing protein [Ktedonobacteraceae bacterium]|jgi:hypothetical protein
MFVRMTTLQHWKSEHDASSCEDAVQGDPARGLFAIADGAGTTLFSHIWAKALVTCFLQIPLLSNDAFEVEWWIRQAQEYYLQNMPTLPTSSWNALQKIQKQGSHATLAALRLLSSNEQAAQGIFLTVGDSCLLLRKASSDQLYTFPYTRPEEFEAAPVCLPSMRSLFDRAFHHPLFQPVVLQAGDRAILATDAVARWIISAGKGTCSQAVEAFQMVAEQTPQSWPAFIEACRARGEMVDDDSTVLHLAFMAQATPDAQVAGVTSGHSPQIRASRRQAFIQAQQENNKELLAIYYGDGADLSLEELSLAAEQRDQARQVADALHAVLTELRKALHRQDLVPSMRQVWTQYAPLLASEPCAANLRRTLTQSGVLPLPPTTPLAASTSPRLPEPAPAAEQQQEGSPAPETGINEQQTIRESLASRSIEQMATAYSLLPADSSFLDIREREQLELAHRFKVAFDARQDEELFSVYILMQDGYQSCFELAVYENERIAILVGRQDSQSDHRQAASRTISESRFRKVCLVKSFYLLYKEQRWLPTEQIEQLALADLTNEQSIEQGIAEINHAKKSSIINWQRELPADLKRFRNAQKQNYQTLIDNYQISKDEISEIVAIFVRAQLLAEYLQDTVRLSLENWLEIRQRSRSGSSWRGSPEERRGI